MSHHQTTNKNYKMEVLYILWVGDLPLYINEYIRNVYNTIGFFSVRRKEMLQLCNRKVNVKIPKL
jgi:hypothetical protein